MDKNLSIVVIDTRPYRVIAQENWGLNKNQMKGMHVHHRLPVSEGGTNDPSNLFVCSPSMHRWGWHDGEAFVEWGTKAAEVRDKIEHKETSRQCGLRSVREGTGLFGRSPEKRKSDAIGAAKEAGKLPWWHNGEGKTLRARECPGKDWSRGRGPAFANKLENARSIRFMCLVTGKISNAANLTRFQKVRGIDTSLRVKLTKET